MPAELSRFRELRRAIPDRSPEAGEIPGYAPAAVAVVCVPDPDAILLIRRAERPGDPWSGQMGLPGGRKGAGDPGLFETAVRETSEEVGLDLGRGHFVGVLEDLTPRTVLLPRIMVRPYVFLLDSRPPLRPNQEVAAAHWVEVAAFLAPGVFAEWEVEALDRSARFPGYRLAEGTVWGMTERILTPFLRVVSRES